MSTSTMFRLALTPSPLLSFLNRPLSAWSLYSFSAVVDCSYAVASLAPKQNRHR